MLPARLAFVDVETTGTGPTHDRIIEIGIVLIEDGQVVEEFTSLVDPGSHLAPEITSLTGITAGELESSPTFRGISDQVLALLDNSLFVAHNARFDYTFIKKEFARLGIRWSAQQLCTVKLSRALFPHHPHHSLDDLIANHGLACEHRHRALPDAQVVHKFLTHLQTIVDPLVLDQAVGLQFKSATIPSHLIRNWPTSAGVYIFYAEDGTTLYVGKSINIKSRILQHFGADAELALTKNIHSIETKITSGELSALLLESQLIKQLKPLHNRRLRSRTLNHYLTKTITPQGYFSVAKSTDLPETDQIVAISKSAAAQRKLLMQVVRDHGLCAKLLGLETGSGPCFAAQFGKCQACTGGEPTFKYNARFVQAFHATSVKPWPFPGPIVIAEGDSGYVFNNWCHEDQPFDWDTYKILLRHIIRHPNNAKLIRS